MNRKEMQRFDCLAKETQVLGPHFLEASAGTGKTFAIEHIVARLLLSGEFDLEEILVVTFTRAAARELKLRIRSNLDRIVGAVHNTLPYLSEGVNCTPLADALAIFDRCQIFTIHSFCSRMLTEFGLEAGIDPKTATESGKREAAVRDFLETLSSDIVCPAQLDLFLRWAGSIEELVYQLKTSAAPMEAKSFSERLREFQAVCPTLDPSKLRDDWKAVQGNYKKVKGDLEGQIEALGSKDFQKLVQEKGSIFLFLAPENKKVRVKEPSFLHYPDFFNWGREHLFPLIQCAADPKEILQSILAVWKPIDRKILLEEANFSNDDLLHAMREAVSIDRFREKVQQKYSAVLIDEFQDTDPVQWDIFAKLFLSAKALYLIGDPKQSIYRFRNADLYTYLKAKQSIPPEGHFYLDTNFRSSQQLLTALNHLFDRTWLHLPREKTVIPYISVRAGLDLQTEIADGKGAIHLVSIAKEEIYPYCANEILRMHKEGVSFREWAILVKDRYEAARMEKMLTSVGVPSSCRSKELLSDTLAFEAIYELLQAMQHPTHLGLAKRVLAGPFGNSEDLQKLEASPFGSYSMEDGLAPFFQAFLRDRPMISAEFHADCQQVLEHLFDWEQKKGFSFEGALSFLDSFLTKDRDEAIYQRKEEGAGDVQIMTIHMSKGLEFPFVFALGLASRTPPGDEEAEAEKLRQLYVGATRAKKRLYVPIPVDEEAAEGTHAPMELFCQYLSEGKPWEEELQRIASISSLTYEKVAGPVVLEKGVECKDTQPLASQPLSIPPFDPSYLLSFTSLSKGIELEPLDPLPEGELPRGAETGTLIHRIFERIFLEKGAWKERAAVSNFVHEELAGGPLASWEDVVEGMVQASLDLPLPDGFCLRQLETECVRPEVEFLFDSSPHYLKGFIDLLFAWQGKYYLVDWKTNWLKGYDQEHLEEAMLLHKYDLQASIYKEALSKRGIEAKAIYLFIRGPNAISL
jgi:exodeoxyribonuclease V beta subunit